MIQIQQLVGTMAGLVLHVCCEDGSGEAFISGGGQELWATQRRAALTGSRSSQHGFSTYAQYIQV